MPGSGIQHYWQKSSEDILELAMVFFLFTGDTTELARGIGTYYQELGIPGGGQA